MPARCLAFHAPYQCRHAGACCEAEWDIEVEPAIVTIIRGRTIPSLPAGSSLVTKTDEEGREFLAPARTSTGACLFHTSDRCGLQLAGGEPLLPSACRHFPRVYLRDGRGTLVTLSHYCPTAAALLLDGRDSSIVEARPPLDLDGPVEGLDARDALPPLLRPGMLMDIEAYDAWERSAIGVLSCGDDIALALSRIVSATERLRGWTPGGTPLLDAVHDTFDSASAVAPVSGVSRGFDIARAVTGPHPLFERASDLESAWAALTSADDGTLRGALGRYLAAATFANWTAYRARGLRTVVEWVRACFDAARLQLAMRVPPAAMRRDDVLEAFRMADLLMVHTVDSRAFGSAAAALEE